MARKPGGHDGLLCGANKRQGEGTCTQVAGWGTGHVGAGPCRLHGGSTRSVSKGARLRLTEKKVRDAVATFGLPIETTPEAAILAEVYRTAGHVKWLGGAVAELSPEALTWGTTQIKTGGHDGGETESAEPHVLLKLYQAERAHLVRVCSEAIRCGIEERQIRLAEQQSALVVQAIRNTFAALALTPEQHAAAGPIVARELRALSNGHA